MMNTAIEIIIPTTATLARKQSLLEAIESVVTQEGVNATALVVVNGCIYDQDLYVELQNRKDIRFHYEREGSLPNALMVGRKLVTAPYFGFLDDDDLLLDGALQSRLSGIDAADAAVSNGFFDRRGKRKLMRKSFDGCEDYPLDELFKANWLASCGALFRSETVGLGYFLDLPKYFEWTYVAFCLAHDGKRLKFLDIPTFHVRDSGVSLSKEDGNPEALVEFLTGLMQRPMDRKLKKKLNVKIGSAYHLISIKKLKSGSIGSSFMMHLKSLNCLENMKYLSYSIHLVRAVMNRNQPMLG